MVMALLAELRVTLGAFLVDIFTPGFFAQKSAGKLVGASSYTRTISSFLRGKSNARVSTVLALWLKHPWGLPKKDDPERAFLFSLSTPWSSMKHARTTLTSWAAQACAKALERETRRVIEPEHGLHAMIHTPSRSGSGSNTASSNARPLVRWNDIGAKTIAGAQRVFETVTPLLWGFVRQVAEKHRDPADMDKRELRPWPLVRWDPAA